jgi:hypothetical protein
MATKEHPPVSSLLDVSQSPATVFAALDPAVQRLVVVTYTLYNGNWDDCAEDLSRRSAGQPYLYRLKIELDDAPGWLARLKAYEQARGEQFAAVARHADQADQVVKKDLH